MALDYIDGRLAYLRSQIELEQISYGEIAELQGLAEHISADDLLLREWAGIPEHDPFCQGCEHDCPHTRTNPAAMGSPYCSVCDDHYEASEEV